MTQVDDQDEQRQLFAKVFATKTSAEWVDVFSDLDACVTPVLSPDEAFKHPHNRQRNSFISGQDSQTMGAPAPKLSRTPGCAEFRSLPAVGSNTVDVLKEHGFTSSEVETLISDGTVLSSKL